jgi:hypothetical protein
MTSFQLPPAFFPENAITRAELSYQTRSAKKMRPWRRWINRTIMWLAITLALIQFGGLLAASLTQRDPTRIGEALDPLPSLLMFFTVYYHFYLMFQTIALASNSITREKEAQTWEMLVLTGIDARQIVRGKWWASVQHQLPRYLLLGLLRAGATAALVIRFLPAFSYSSSYYQNHIQLPHPVTILVAGLLGFALTIGNLGVSAACGVMASAVSKRSTLAIARGFANQIVITLLPIITIVFVATRIRFGAYNSAFYQVLSMAGMGLISLVDNGFTLLSTPLNLEYGYYNLESYSPIARIQVDWMISGLLALVFYALLVWFALWRAEKRAVKALATPVG